MSSIDKVNLPGSFRTTIDPAKLNPKDPEFFHTLDQVFANAKSKLSPIGPGVYVPAQINITPSPKINELIS